MAINARFIFDEQGPGFSFTPPEAGMLPRIGETVILLNRHGKLGRTGRVVKIEWVFRLFEGLDTQDAPLMVRIYLRKDG